MSRTTPLPSHDVESLFPFLAGQGKSSARLHPRPTVNLPSDATKLGGSILWPSTEDTPICSVTGIQANPVFQLNRRDLPSFPFPEGMDLLQVVWFPMWYPPVLATGTDAPRIEIHWRNTADIDEHHVLAPTDEAEEFFVLRECAVTIEEVIEYPYIERLQPAEQTAIHDWEKQVGLPGAYQNWLSTCPGTKLGGYPQWAGQEPTWPVDKAGTELDYLMTFSDHEWDSGSHSRWRPIEFGPPPIAGKDRIEVEEGTAPLGSSFEFLNVYLDKTETPWVAVASG